MTSLHYNPEIDSLICEQYLLEQGKQTPTKELRLIEILNRLDILTNCQTIFHDMALDEQDNA